MSKTHSPSQPANPAWDGTTYDLRRELENTFSGGEADAATRANARRATRLLIAAERAEAAGDQAAAAAHLAAADRACPHPEEG